MARDLCHAAEKLLQLHGAADTAIPAVVEAFKLLASICDKARQDDQTATPAQKLEFGRACRQLHKVAFFHLPDYVCR